jgi:hypothetical protein
LTICLKKTISFPLKRKRMADNNFLGIIKSGPYRGEIVDTNTLSSKGIAFYKNKEYWEPIEAATVAAGFEPSLDCNKNLLYANSKKIMEASIIAYKEKKLRKYKEITNFKHQDVYKKTYPEFFREDEFYKTNYLICFKPLEYIQWLISEKIEKLHEEFRIIKNDGVFTWGFPTHNIPRKNTVHTVFQDAMDEAKNKIIERMKRYDFWSLQEAIALVSEPLKLIHATGSLEPEKEMAKAIYEDLDEEFFFRAIKTGTLKVQNFNKEKVLNWDGVYESPYRKGFSFWYDCYAQLKVNPFVFLDFIKPVHQYEIRTALDFEKKISKSGENQYFWASEFNESFSQENLSYSKNTSEDIEAKINFLLEKIRPEIDNFYELMKLHALNDERRVLNISYKDACEVIEKNKDTFKKIKFDDISASFFGSEKPFREIKGGLMRNIILRTYPEAKAHTSNIKLSAQDLYKRSNSLKKS